ncbi:type II toxin-antitoxin system VapC family toxin [Bosea caraganae]|uniref:Ribonuclease VapC n=1 Tax=Bosea caraganae TaxID=2763117 RepID=A0A370L6E8_9HYPH|nr:type II toxin-antitoxin system VapC family toxin [Bosea caraganae]RDJ25294.1 type II toxin-antitoxin system VapC family toxin [Bosea caraganae]RDJ25923.1 type II toxin-antitoxin system VapC family toxin [Bosea caraganae]
MILLDTNVVSEPLKLAGDEAVLRWLDAQAVETLYLSTIGLAEMLFGVAALPEGRRRSDLRMRLDRDVIPLFDGRILSFDRRAAEAYAELRAKARLDGRAIAQTDGYIAAIAAAHGFAVATRDIGAFEAAGVRVINPWEA